MIAIYWLDREREGEVLRGWMPFICWKTCFRKSTDICISWGQSIEHGKNILMSLKAAVGKRQAPFEYIHTAPFEVHTAPSPKDFLHSWCKTIFKGQSCFCGLKRHRRNGLETVLSTSANAWKRGIVGDLAPRSIPCTFPENNSAQNITGCNPEQNQRYKSDSVPWGLAVPSYS